MRLAASIEAGSEHPLAAAVVHRASQQNLPLAKASKVTYLPGRGLCGEVNGTKVVLGKSKLFVRARRLSRATMGNVRQNLFWAFAYNSLGVPVAAGVLYPLFGILLSPIFAAAAMTFSSVSVIGNTLRLYRIRL